MTPSEVLVPGAIAIVFVVAWFVFGVIDATRRDAETPRRTETPRNEPVAHPVRDTTYLHRR